MYRHVLEFEALFEDHALERPLHEQRALAQPLPSALQVANRQKGSMSCLISLLPMLSHLTPVRLH